MLTIEKNSNAISFTYGDNLTLNVTLKDYTTTAGDVATLAIKQSEGDTAIKMAITGTITSITGGTFVTFTKTATEMKALDVGSYIYDISIVNSTISRTTFMFTSSFDVKAVAHNV